MHECKKMLEIRRILRKVNRLASYTNKHISVPLVSVNGSGGDVSAFKRRVLCN